jgi:hypothetical protein
VQFKLINFGLEIAATLIILGREFGHPKKEEEEISATIYVHI